MFDPVESAKKASRHSYLLPFLLNRAIPGLRKFRGEKMFSDPLGTPPLAQEKKQRKNAEKKSEKNNEAFYMQLVGVYFFSVFPLPCQTPPKRFFSAPLAHAVGRVVKGGAGGRGGTFAMCIGLRIARFQKLLNGKILNKLFQ